MWGGLDDDEDGRRYLRKPNSPNEKQMWLGRSLHSFRQFSIRPELGSHQGTETEGCGGFWEASPRWTIRPGATFSVCPQPVVAVGVFLGPCGVLFSSSLTWLELICLQDAVPPFPGAFLASLLLAICSAHFQR